MWVVALHADFDQQLDEPVRVLLSYYCRIGLPANCHHQLQQTWHISLLLVTTGSCTHSAGPGDIKLLSRSGPVFVDRSNSRSLELLHSQNVYTAHHTVAFGHLLKLSSSQSK